MLLFLYDTEFTTDTKTISCEHSQQLIPDSRRCLYSADTMGLIDGCRSLSHLQNCGRQNLSMVFGRILYHSCHTDAQVAIVFLYIVTTIFLKIVCSSF